MPTLSFNGSQETKNFYVARAKAHFAADEIVKGQYWEDGKGCAVGCLVHGSSHEKLAEEIGIPLQMAYLIDRLFESQPNGKSKSFPVRFIEAVPVGKDLQGVMDRWYLHLLGDPTHGSIVFANEAVRPSIQTVIDLYRQRIGGDEPRAAAWDAAWDAAGAAAGAAAWNAAGAAARDAAWDAAEAAAWTAARDAAGAAARDAAGAAAWNAAWNAAWDAALNAHFVWQAELLLTLLREAGK